MLGQNVREKKKNCCVTLCIKCGFFTVYYATSENFQFVWFFVWRQFNVCFNLLSCIFRITYLTIVYRDVYSWMYLIAVVINDNKCQCYLNVNRAGICSANQHKLRKGKIGIKVFITVKLKLEMSIFKWTCHTISSNF